MARRQTQSAEAVPQPSELVDRFQAEVAKTAGKGGTPSAAEFVSTEYGVPLTGAIPLQYVMGIDVLPLHRCYEIVGPPSCTKSMMGWRFMTWFFVANGIGVFFDAEHKQNKDQVKGIVNNAELLSKSLMPFPVTSLDQMLAGMAMYSGIYIDFKKKAENRARPMMMLVDSIGTLTSQRTIESIDKKGSTEEAGWDAAKRAATFAEFLRKFMSNDMSKNPFFLVMINHEKDVIDSNRPTFMPKLTSIVGGAYQEFAATTILAMDPNGKTVIEDGVVRCPITITTRKSGFSPKGLKINVDFVTTTKDGALLNDYDWDTCLAELLTDEKVVSATQLEGIGLDLRKEKAWKDKDAEGNEVKHPAGYYSEALGLSGVTAAEAGNRIHRDPDWTHKVQSVLRILNKPSWESYHAGNKGK